MPRALLLQLLLLVLLVGAPARPAMAQVADTLLTWRTYSQEARAHVRVYAAPRAPRAAAASAAARPERSFTAVVDELAENRAGLVTDDARFVAETIGRAIGRDPAEITFVFRFSAASFHPGGRPGGKVLLLRATFGRAKSGSLSTPSWRVITRDELAELTDRALF